MIELLRDIEDLDIAIEMLSTLKRPNDAIKEAITVLVNMKKVKQEEVTAFEEYFEKEMAMASGHLLHQIMADIKLLIKELKDLRNEMVQSNWPAQRISNIITIWEHKIQEQPRGYYDKDDS